MEDQPVKSPTNWLAGVSFGVLTMGLVACAANLLWQFLASGP
jgi:hypothetical protein